jgi:hypothetical protein
MQRRESRVLWAIIALAVVLRLGAGLSMGDAVEVLPGIHDRLSCEVGVRAFERERDS